MLNKKLYNKLLELFGRVIINKPNEAAALRVVEKTVIQGGGVEIEVLSSGEQYCVSCPFCEDTKTHLQISHLYGSKVKIGDRTYKMNTNLAYCFRRNCMAKARNRATLAIQIGNLKNVLVGYSEVDICYEEQEPTFEPMPARLPVDHPATPTRVTNYLLGRGLDLTELTSVWKVGWGYVPFYQDLAAIIPIIQRGILAGWQARYLGNPPDGKPKYYTAKGMRKSWLVYNMDEAKKHSEGVIVEGVFDVFKIGRQGMCLFGKQPSTQQLKILSALFKSNRLVWIPDANDPTAIIIAEQIVAREDVKNMFNRLEIKKLPFGDPGEFTREDLWQIIK